MHLGFLSRDLTDFCQIDNPAVDINNAMEQSKEIDLANLTV